MTTLPLYEPLSDEDLFDSAEEDVLLTRPVMTGDVFVDVDDGDEEPITIAIVGHPCTIRKGPVLERRIPCCVVAPRTQRNPPYRSWPDGHWDRFFLPDGLGLGTNLSVDLLDWRAIRAEQLDLDRRRVILTRRGITTFVQRFTHAITRVPVLVQDFERAFNDVLQEAELEGQWIVEQVSDPRDTSEITRLTKDFQAFLDAEKVSSTSIRELLKGGDAAGLVNRIVAAEIERRSTSKEVSEGTDDDSSQNPPLRFC